MSRIAFKVPGRVRGKLRPRSFIYKSSKSGKLAVGNYTPDKTRANEDTIRFYAREAMTGRQMLIGPLAVDVHLTLHHPVSWSKKRKAHSYWVTGLPDCSNILKSIEDAMSNIVFANDAQIAQLNMTRVYADEIEEYALIIVKPLEA